MKGRHFFAAIMMAGLLVASFNLCVRHLAENLPPQQLLRRIQENASPAQWFFLGDSQMQADADPEAFAKACPAKPAAINVALGATLASEHCLILEYLLPRARAVESVVYGFHDNLLTEIVPGTWHDLFGNRALAYLFPDRASALLAPEDRGQAWRMRWNASVPLIAERAAIWAKVERLRRRLSGAGLPVRAANRFGRAQDFSAFEARDAGAFESNLKTAVETARPFNLPVQQIVQTCAARHLKFYLVAMPMPASHRRRFYGTSAWASYREYLEKLVERSSGTLIDASDWVSEGNFEDSLHLDRAGAAVFSRRLARELCEGNLPPERNSDAHKVGLAWRRQSPCLCEAINQGMACQLLSRSRRHNFAALP